MEERHSNYMARRLKEEKEKLEQPISFSQYGKDEHEVSIILGDEDMVNNPSHYNKTGIECIDAIESMTDEGFEPYLQGNIMKYLWRYKYKNGVEDLKKAQWYLNKLINISERDG